MPKEDMQISTVTDDMGSMSGKGPVERTVMTSTENAQVDDDIVDTYLSLSIKRKNVITLNLVFL